MGLVTTLVSDATIPSVFAGKAKDELPATPLAAANILGEAGHRSMDSDHLAQVITLIARGPHALSGIMRPRGSIPPSWDPYLVVPEVTALVEAKYPDESAYDIKTLVASVVGTITCTFKVSTFEPDQFVFHEDGLKANLERVRAKRARELEKAS